MENEYVEHNKITQVIVCSCLFSTNMNTYILYILIWKFTQAAILADGRDINSNLLNTQSEIQTLVISARWLLPYTTIASRHQCSSC